MYSFLNFILKKEIIGSIITIILALCAYQLFKIIIEKILSKGKSDFEIKRKKTIIELLKTTMKIVTIIIASTIILDFFGVNVTSLVAGLGVVSAVGALSLQDNLKDIIKGVEIITDNYFVVGDYIKYNNFKGQVIELGLRTTKIMDADGEVLIISNRNISEVTNLSQKTSSNLILIPTAYEEKIDKVETVLNEVVEEICAWNTMNKSKTNYIGIVELNESCINYGIRIYCSQEKLWEYRRAVLKLVKQKYDKNHIKIPYPQIEVHHE